MALVKTLLNIFLLIYTSVLTVMVPYCFSFFCLTIFPLKFVLPDLFFFIQTKLYKYMLSYYGFWMTLRGYILHESGDDVRPLYDKKCLVLVNHQSTADVPTLFYSLGVKQNALENIIWVISHEFKWLPFGVASQIHGDIFVKQGRNSRDGELVRLKKLIPHLYETHPKKWLLIFPEGGFYKKRFHSSQLFAKKKNIPHPQFVTLPREGVVDVALNSLRQSANNAPFDYIIDVTMAYENDKPLEIQNIFLGNRPACAVHCHYRAFALKNGTVVDDSGNNNLLQWLYNLWFEKDELMKYFKEHGHFPSKVPTTTATATEENNSHHEKLVNNTKPIEFPLNYTIFIHFIYFLIFIYEYFVLKSIFNFVC